MEPYHRLFRSASQNIKRQFKVILFFRNVGSPRCWSSVRFEPLRPADLKN